ncbi:J domain-containing protein [Variovorax sp. LT1R16]|uniref:J domain-containing protein n=1 Tax=Variovorax sp. LT1R16 TaxID=3443728 RepID=UPI003F448645
MSTVTAAFERLGIAPTRDLKTIKRAYAVALKAIDQASEREAFERLRQAYEQAQAWAARTDEEDDEEEEDEEEYGEDSEDEEDSDTDDQAGPERPDVPAASPFDAPRAETPAPFAPPPAQAPAVPVPPPQRPDEARQALQHWTAQLRDAAPGAVAAVLEDALADPRLLHLDSHAQLEARIADLLHDDPAGRAVLFDIAARRFHWTDRNARPIASTQAAHWISRVINQGLQWQAQTPAAIALQQQALATVTRVPSPQAEQTRSFAEVLEHMAGDFPDWFALHLAPQGHAHLPAWQAVHAKLAPRWARQAERKERHFGTPRKTLNTVVGGLFVLVLATAVLSGVMNRLLGSHAPPAVAAAPGKTGIGAPPATPELVLAYEFTGPVTRDSCESAEEFVHESNWLQVDDSDAVALLATRAIRCQDKGLWSRKDDTLMACLRAERAAALGAGRPEEAQRCLKLDAAGK